MRMNTKSASFAAAGTVLLWASAFPAISVAVRGLGPAGLAVARLAVASAVLALAHSSTVPAAARVADFVFILMRSVSSDSSLRSSYRINDEC